MKIYTAEQIKRWDIATIENEGITSLDLMEHAAERCVSFLEERNLLIRHVNIFCGKGNNGGDGLAMARLLFNRQTHVTVYILENGNPGSEDFQKNLQRLRTLPISILYIQYSSPLPFIDPSSIVIDGLYGIGINRPLEGISKTLVQHINKSGAIIIAIDIPSGLFLEQSSVDRVAIKADYTLTFQTYKLALLLAENASFIGEVYVLDIGLDKQFYENEDSSLITLEGSFIQKLYIPRNRFSHKGTFGHALIIGGSYGKIGALVLAATACARSGCGLTTVYTPTCGYTIMQTVIPEAMTLMDDHEQYITSLPNPIDSYSSIGIGPGLGTAPETQQMIKQLIKDYIKPIVFDADALNCLSLNKELLHYLPPNSILTPHPKEFDRLFGESKSEVERINKALNNAQALNVIIVLKGHHTFIANPDGKGYFNTTGNAGMSKGGSGDVLTGLLTSLIAQGYSPEQAALMGVYLHGLAGDLALNQFTQETMLASDLINAFTPAFRIIQSI